MLPIVGLEDGAGFEPAAGGSPVQVVPDPPVRQGGPRGSRTLRGTVDEAPPGKPAWPASLDGAAPFVVSPVRFSFPFNQAERVRLRSRENISLPDKTSEPTDHRGVAGLAPKVSPQYLEKRLGMYLFPSFPKNLLRPRSNCSSRCQRRSRRRRWPRPIDSRLIGIMGAIPTASDQGAGNVQHTLSIRCVSCLEEFKNVQGSYRHGIASTRIMDHVIS